MAENLDGRTLSLSDRDPNPGPLMPKLMAGRNVSIKNYGQAIKIDVDVPLTEGTKQAIENIGKVCVQQQDTPEYLRSKILQGDRITITDNDHTLTINADVQNGDHKVLASSGDTTADYLDQKLSGSGVVAVTDNTTSLSVGITPSSTDGQVLTTDNGSVAWKTPTTQTGDHKVAVNSSDSSPDYLFSKIEAGTNISTSVSSGKVKIDAATQTGDHKVVVDSSDTNPQYLGNKLKAGVGMNISYYNHDKMEIASLGQCKVALLGTMDYLGNKILQGSGITLTKTDNDITIAADTQTGDHKVSTDGTDTANYLENKIEAGSNVSITKSSGKLVISSTDTGMLNPMTTSGDIITGGASGTPGRLGVGTNGQVLMVSSGVPSWQTIPTQTGDHKVIVDGADTWPSYLKDKLQAGTGITLNNTGSRVEIVASTQTGDHKVCADGTDTAGYLEDKVEAGTNVSITKTAGKLVISSTDTGMLNPMTTSGDLIVGGASGAPTRLAKGYQGQVLKVGSSGLEWGTDVGFANPMEEQGDLILGSYDGVASRLPIGTVNQFLFSNGTTAEWATLPLNIDWVVPPALANGEFNQSVDRTFYVRVYPSLQMRSINHVAVLLNSSVTADVWRVAVFDSSRNMVLYGESTGSASAFQRIALTQLQPWTPATNNYYYLAISQHVAGSSSSKIKTASVTNPSYCWYEDVALTSGRAMPSTSSLTASTSKVPIIGLRGR